MKLRKALDRAKQELQQASPATTRMSSGMPFDNETQNLDTLIYSESRHVTLDYKILEKNRCVSLLPDSMVSDLYKGVRTQIIQRMRDKQWNVLMITSALQGEGKSLTAINLAITFAKEKNHSVLLVDGDLRRQNIHKYLDYESKEGLVDYLVNDIPMQELIVWPGIEKLTVISGGQTIQDSTELLSSFKMKALISEMKSRYKNRSIQLESPPILSGPDTAAFSPLVDAIVMVVEAGKTSIEDVKKALELIPKEKFLGFILNKKKKLGRGYYAGYYNAEPDVAP